jgi:hypothetical protein
MFAKKMIYALDDGQRIINIDETWLSETDFRRRKWRKRGTTNSVIEKTMNSRISMIAAIDTEGEIYISLT